MNPLGGKEQAQVEIGIFAKQKKKHDRDLARRVETKTTDAGTKSRAEMHERGLLMSPHVDAHTDVHRHGRAGAQRQTETLPSSEFSQSLNQSHTKRLTAQRLYNSIISNQ